jgi:TPR repeat protein
MLVLPVLALCQSTQFAETEKVKAMTAEQVQDLQKAAERGDPYSQVLLAIAYTLGRHVTQSDAEAVKWMRQAAEHGDPL